jgi:hypothetical protein
VIRDWRLEVRDWRLEVSGESPEVGKVRKTESLGFGLRFRDAMLRVLD